MWATRICDWFALRDYERAKEKAAADLAARYSRGNTAMQNAWFIDQRALDALSVAGDTAARSLQTKKPISH
jgi:hypothetical protein